MLQAMRIEVRRDNLLEDSFSQVHEVYIVHNSIETAYWSEFIRVA
jgi:hypothetical protein